MTIRWLGTIWKVDDRREFNSKLPPGPDRPAFVLSTRRQTIKVYERDAAYAFIERKVTA